MKLNILEWDQKLSLSVSVDELVNHRSNIFTGIVEFSIVQVCKSFESHGNELNAVSKHVYNDLLHECVFILILVQPFGELGLRDIDVSVLGLNLFNDFWGNGNNLLDAILDEINLLVQWHPEVVGSIKVIIGCLNRLLCLDKSVNALLLMRSQIDLK